MAPIRRTLYPGTRPPKELQRSRGRIEIIHDQVAMESVSDEDLRDQLVNVLLAGRDTTACCLSWTLYVLYCVIKMDSANICS